MKWQSGRRGGNIEDRRRMSGGQKLTLGGIGGVVVLIIGFLLGGDPGQLLNQMQQGGGITTAEGTYQSTPEEDRLLDFADVVLASTDDIWTNIFKESGKAYLKPGMVIYTEGTATEGCGYGQSHFGPFYCL